MRHGANPLRFWSGWRDSNARPQRPERCTLAKLSHIPNSIKVILNKGRLQDIFYSHFFKKLDMKIFR